MDFYIPVLISDRFELPLEGGGTLGKEVFFSCSNPLTRLTVEGYPLAALPATGGISPSFWKGYLGSRSQHPQYSLVGINM